MRTNLNGSTAVIIDPKKNEINEEETFDLPLDISDIINVCREYSKLGWTVQTQIECIMEIGIQEAVNSGAVSIPSLPHIKNFLQQIQQNGYFGDASSQSNDLLQEIDCAIEKYNLYPTEYN